MTKNEILLNPSSLPVSELIRSIVSGIVTFEELAKGNELDAFTMEFLWYVQASSYYSFDSDVWGEEFKQKLIKAFEETYIQRFENKFLYVATRPVIYDIIERNEQRLLPKVLSVFSGVLVFNSEEGSFEQMSLDMSREKLVKIIGDLLSQEIMNQLTDEIQSRPVRAMDSLVPEIIRRIESPDFQERLIPKIDCILDAHHDDIMGGICYSIDETLEGGYAPVSHYSRIDDSAVHNSTSSDNPTLFSLLASRRLNFENIISRGRKQVYAGVFAPATVSVSNLLKVQVHLFNKRHAQIIERKAKALDPSTKLGEVNPLGLLLKKGTAVNVDLSLYHAGIVFDKERATVIWNGEPVSTVFHAVVHDAIGKELVGEVTLSVGEVPVGVLSFMTKIVIDAAETPAEVGTQSFRKVFISYSNKDVKTAEIFASAYRAQGVKCFFARHSLGAGDVFNEEIMHNIEESDLFLLLWSENAAKSANVEKEYMHAIEFAYPQKAKEEATLVFKPFFIEPHAEPPVILKDIYHFSTIHSV